LRAVAAAKGEQFKMSSNDMPSPYSRDAPKFDYKNPQELNRFIRRVEELFDKCGIDSDDEKIKYLGIYADARTEREWEGMSSHASGNFSSFKKEIVESYPEAYYEMRGSMIELKRIINRYSDLMPEDMVQLQAFKRAFVAEAKKLRADPPLLSNREAVTHFLTPLSETFRQRILTKLDLVEMVKSSSDKDRRPEDRFNLTEIIEMAIQIARSSPTSYALDDNSPLESELRKNASRFLPEVEDEWVEEI
jgi:hypothetical protein